MNFSVCIIARNEEKTLPRMLDSLKEFKSKGGEVLICDTGSTDKTVEIAKSYGCIVYEEGNKFRTILGEELVEKINNFIGSPVLKDGVSYFDYSAARNYIASKASNDMIAMPDADECYTKLDLGKVEQLIKEGVEQFEYNFVFSHDEQGREVIKFSHSKFYNRIKQRWVGVVHEILQGEARRQFVGEDVIKLEHFQNHETNRSGYLPGLAIDCYLNQSNDRNSHYLGRELLSYGLYRAAIKELKRHLSISSWAEERGQSMIYIGEAYMKLGKTKQAIDWWHKSIQECSTRREPFMALADYYYKIKDATQTAIYCAAALQIPLSRFYANNVSLYEEKPHELMYWAKWYLVEREEGLEHLKKAIGFIKKTEYLYDLRWFTDLPKVTIILPTLGREEGLQKCLESIKKLNYPEELIETLVLHDEPRMGVPLRVKEGYEKGTGEVFCFASNDIEFDPNSLILAIMEMKKGKRLVSFNTGEFTDNGNICEHFIIHKTLIPEIGGEIFDTEFFHVGVDKLLWEKCKKLNEAVCCKDALVNHTHFSRIGSGVQMDEINKLGWSHAEEDRKLLEKKLQLI